MTDDLEHLINDLRGPDFWQAFTHGGGALSDWQSSAPFRAADEIARLRAENEALREALGQIVQWADAYPREVFEEPDLEAVKTLLTNAGMRVQMDRMHAAWARHLTEGFGRIARQALQEGPSHE